MVELSSLKKEVITRKGAETNCKNAEPFIKWIKSNHDNVWPITRSRARANHKNEKN